MQTIFCAVRQTILGNTLFDGMFTTGNVVLMLICHNKDISTNVNLALKMT